MNCKLTILIPCLNEAETIGLCIKKAQDFITSNNIDGEVLIADNNSTDGSSLIAHQLGARVIKCKHSGYGIALIAGSHAAKGDYIIMGDADDSYNFSECKEFITKLDQGYDLVLGNRYCGHMEKGAMKPLHKYLGTPVISFIANLIYHTGIKDFNSGMRGYRRDSFLKLNCKCTGMEFASEMIIKAKLNNLKITEIPINFYKDKRNKSSHLNPVRDGIRHLKYIILQR